METHYEEIINKAEEIEIVSGEGSCRTEEEYTGKKLYVQSELN